MKRYGILIGLSLLLAILVAGGWYFFINRTVREEKPFHFPRKDEIGMILPPTATLASQVAAKLFPPSKATTAAITASSIITAVENTPAVVVTPTLGAKIVATATVEVVPADTPVVLSQGNFVGSDSFHKGSGTATLYRAPDGSYSLHFTNFKATNGPDLHVLLSPNIAPANHASLGKYLDLGLLKGNIGDQQYKLPRHFDPTDYKSVVVHCLAYQVVFATADLE